MNNDRLLFTVYPMDSDIRLVQIAPGVDPRKEPLLSHAGLVCDLGDRVEIAMNGIDAPSPRTRQFLTTVGNDLTVEILEILAGEFNDPAYREQMSPELRARLDQIRDDAEDIPSFQ